MGLRVESAGQFDDVDDGAELATFAANQRHLFRVVSGELGTASAVDVAAYILRTYGDQDAIRLQKLLYFCQAKRLADARLPLFGEELEGWVYGPVAVRVYQCHRGNRKVSERDLDREEPHPEALTKDERRTIDEVVDLLKHHSQWDLMNISHQGQPWRDSRQGLSPGQFGQAVVAVAGLADDWSDRIWPELRRADQREIEGASH